MDSCIDRSSCTDSKLAAATEQGIKAKIRTQLWWTCADSVFFASTMARGMYSIVKCHHYHHRFCLLKLRTKVKNKVIKTRVLPWSKHNLHTWPITGQHRFCLGQWEKRIWQQTAAVPSSRQSVRWKVNTCCGDQCYVLLLTSAFSQTFITSNDKVKDWL